MNSENYFKDLLESIFDFRKIVFYIFSIQNDNHFLTDCGFLENDKNHLREEFKNILLEQNEEYLD